MAKFNPLYRKVISFGLIGRMELQKNPTGARDSYKPRSRKWNDGVEGRGCTANFHFFNFISIPKRNLGIVVLCREQGTFNQDT